MYTSPRTTSPDARTRSRGRVVVAFLLIFAAGILVRLVQVQLFEHSHWAAAAETMQERQIDVMPRRGAIYDRDGTVLAYDVKAKAIAIDGFNMTRPATLVEILSEVLGKSVGEISDKVYRASYFTWIDRQVDLDKANEIERRARDAGAYGLIFIDAWKRSYPQGRLASNVVGFVGTDGAGLEGLELAYDDLLRGTPTQIRIVEGADGKTYGSEMLSEGTPGLDLHLSISAALQFVCEQEIENGVSRYRANAGMAIALDPRTGEVLAMAQDKSYDLNNFWTSTLEQRRNLAVTYLFEPGSIFKVFAGLAALEAGTVAVDDTFNGDDGIEISGHVMHNADNWSYGTVTFADVIAESINTGMIQVALHLGADRLRGTLADVGFGARTGIELPGEEKGILRPAQQWTTLDLASASIGQSVAVTGIQLARGLATVANGGLLVPPHVVLAVGDDAEDLPEATRVLSAASCDTMRQLMVGVVENPEGTGVLAALDGFTVAGKTGTAQKAVGGKGYVEGKYTSLFAGMFPAEDPEIVILVVLDEVKVSSVGGGSTAAPIFKNIASRWIRMGEVLPYAGP
jgi:cell division protein FtsI/penicillin-binding protein 2